MNDRPHDLTTIPEGERAIEEKILHILNNYPTISPSMLQISIGSGMPTAMWKPVLNRLIREKRVFEAHRIVKAPSGRYETKILLSKNYIDAAPTEDL